MKWVNWIAEVCEWGCPQKMSRTRDASTHCFISYFIFVQCKHISHWMFCFRFNQLNWKFVKCKRISWMIFDGKNWTNREITKKKSIYQNNNCAQNVEQRLWNKCVWKFSGKRQSHAFFLYTVSSNSVFVWMWHLVCCFRFRICRQMNAWQKISIWKRMKRKKTKEKPRLISNGNNNRWIKCEYSSNVGRRESERARERGQQNFTHITTMCMQSVSLAFVNESHSSDISFFFWVLAHGTQPLLSAVMPFGVRVCLWCVWVRVCTKVHATHI